MEYFAADPRVLTRTELQRRSLKILLGQWPLSKRFLLSNAGFIALPSIKDSLASVPPQGKILPIETKCLMYVYASDLWSLQINLHLVSIGPDNAPSILDS